MKKSELKKVVDDLNASCKKYHKEHGKKEHMLWHDVEDTKHKNTDLVNNAKNHEDWEQVSKEFFENVLRIRVLNQEKDFLRKEDHHLQDIKIVMKETFGFEFKYIHSFDADYDRSFSGCDGTINLERVWNSVVKERELEKLIKREAKLLNK